MHDMFNILFGAFLRLVNWTSDLAKVLNDLGHQPAQSGGLISASVVTTSVLVCVLACLWALSVRARATAQRYAMANNLARAQAQIRFREAIIQASPEAVVVMGADLAAPLSYQGGSALLQAGLAGPDSQALAAHLDTLLACGAPFTLVARTAKQETIAIQGRVVGSRAALYLRREEDSEGARDALAVLDALAVPVWIRNTKLALVWANRAFLAATGSPTLDAALAADPKLIRAERDLASAALEGRDVIGERRYSVISGRRRALSVDLHRLSGGRVAGTALDVTDAAQAEAQFKLAADAQGDMLEQLDRPVAIFGTDRRLAYANQAFARLWGLSRDWLDECPALDDVFDRLRESRRLPEQRDFQAWKRTHLDLFATETGSLEETWHIAGGVSVRVRAFPYLLGGVAYMFEDITEPLRLSTTLHILQSTQRAMLDSIEDGLAMFGPDGRLKMYNTAFADLWKLNEAELLAEPHLAQVEALATARIGRDGVWSLIASGVTSGEPRRYGEWGRLVRADGRILSVSLDRLSLGATLVRFEDLTDLERFNAALQTVAAA